MPYTLSAEERERIIAEYRENVEQMNRFLPEGHKIKMDLNGLNAKLNDEDKVRFYKRGQELQAIDKQKKEQCEALRNYSQFKVDQNKVYALDKSLFAHLKPGNTEYERAYNKVVVNHYLENPEKFFQESYRDVLEMYPKDYFDAATAKDADNYLLEFYAMNSAQCNDANAVDMAFLSNKELINSDTDIMGPAQSQTYKKTIGNIANMVNNVSKESLFTVPDITQQQYELMVQNGVKQDKQVFDKMVEKNQFDNARNQVINNAQKFLKNVPENVDLERHGGLTQCVGFNKDTGEIMPLIDVVSENMMAGNNNPISVEKINNSAKMENIYRITKRDYQMDKYTEAFPEKPKLSRDEELAKMQKKAMDEYAIVNRFSAAQRDKLTPQEMLNRTKPGFVRGLFSRDSKEWKDFEYMYKAFHDEKNVYYKNTTELRAEAQKYLDAKGIALLEDIENLPERSQQKALLCYTICTKYEDLDPLDTSPKIQREQAIENVDVLNDGPSSQNENKNDLENLMDLSVDDLDNSLDK